MSRAYSDHDRRRPYLQEPGVPGVPAAASRIRRRADPRRPDKFFNFTVESPRYLAPWINDLMPATGQEFMYVVGRSRSRPVCSCWSRRDGEASSSRRGSRRHREPADVQPSALLRHRASRPRAVHRSGDVERLATAFGVTTAASEFEQRRMGGLTPQRSRRGTTSSTFLSSRPPAAGERRPLSGSFAASSRWIDARRHGSSAAAGSGEPP